MAIPTVVGVALMVASLVPAVAASPRPLVPLAMLAVGLQALVLYFPVTFVLKEVAFRGALDAHLHAPGERHGWLTALFVSALWGLWHLPVAGSGAPLAVTVAQLLIVHCTVGVPLSFGWRRTGTLVAPALAHTLIDAVRNGLMSGL